jgi:beta-galactosidase
MKNSIILSLCFLVLLLSQCKKPGDNRKVISLNGVWDIAESAGLDDIPDTFSGQVPVPGLIDMATTQFDSIGVNRQNRFYWYRKTFSIPDNDSEKVILKINKAKYGTWVYVNGKFAGQNLYCFTPAVLDIKKLLNETGVENELLIGIGSYSHLPDTIANGWDFEKTKYIPGIYDDVQLIIAGYPFIKNVQVVPDIGKEEIRVRTYLEYGNKTKNYDLVYAVKEVSSDNLITQGEVSIIPGEDLQDTKDFSIKMADCHLWTPDDPFLYKLEIITPADHYTTRFGMREFYFDTITRRAILNGKPYYMRGTNVCIYRFFEDPSRDGLPWDKEWVRKLHETFKSMHWNSIRYCIGFPPEIWYDIADEVGFLIQDEFPLWYLNRKEELAPELKSGHLAAEYREWMEERWNHPCVVIWDAQNETYTDETGIAIGMVRDMDMSDRPWDNGWSQPQKLSDVIETHPYIFSRYQYMSEGNALPPEGVLKHHLSESRRPHNGPDGDNAIIINEYGWLWLNRDGSPTTLTDRIYATLFSECTSPEARFEVYAKHLGILTEYWRAHRQCAGVLHFCGLGYSRTEEPRGQTSDHFIDLQQLVLESNFVKFVKPAFSPVGIMIDKWDIAYKAGEEIKVPVIIINDTYDDYSDTLKITVFRNEEPIEEKFVLLSVEKLGQAIDTFEVKLRAEKGSYRMEAELMVEVEPVRSIREFVVE